MIFTGIFRVMKMKKNVIGIDNGVINFLLIDIHLHGLIILIGPIPVIVGCVVIFLGRFSFQPTFRLQNRVCTYTLAMTQILCNTTN